MDTSQIVWIVVAVVVVLIIIGVIARVAGRKKAERNREEAGRIRAEEQESQLQARERANAAQRTKADADAAELKSKEREIEAQRLQAEAKDAEIAAERKRMDADQQAAAANEQQQASEARLRHADRLDPDAGKDVPRDAVNGGTGRRADAAVAGGPAETGHRRDPVDPVDSERGEDAAPVAGEARAEDGGDAHHGRNRQERVGDPADDRGPGRRRQRAGAAGESVAGNQSDVQGERSRGERAGDPAESERRQEGTPVVGDPLATDRPDAYGEAAAQRKDRGAGENDDFLDDVDAADLDAKDPDQTGRHGDVPKHRD
ncbi:hypothetical protein ACTXI0_14850 [Arthrobacter rhombi]|uniref:hypothetical protein n=1 Tax=Arthrobacter rhombi TaxID=71253 RepID=UPI003FD25A11